jgi:hypothetical protein
LIVAYLLAAASYELVLALQHTFTPHGAGFVLLFALVAMLGAMVLAIRGAPLAGLFAPTAALFVTAHFYTGDPYYNYGYGPTFTSYAHEGGFSPTWIYTLLGLALIAGLTTWRWQRTRPVETVVVLVLLAITALFMGTH